MKRETKLCFHTWQLLKDISCGWYEKCKNCGRIEYINPYNETRTEIKNFDLLVFK